MTESTLPTGNRFVNLIGKVFGRLTVVSYAGRFGEGKQKRIKWNCRCECGTETAIDGGKLSSGWTQSCGCLQRERASAASTTHGKSGKDKSPEYVSWSKMIYRCTNPHSDRFRFYGKRGITVCQQWRDSFEVFLKDMGEKPEPKAKYSIDRINTHGNYEPGNCKWATHLEQMRNQRSNINVTFRGETKCLREWAGILGFNYLTLYGRVVVRKWDIERAFTTPTRGITQCDGLR